MDTPKQNQKQIKKFQKAFHIKYAKESRAYVQKMIKDLTPFGADNTNKPLKTDS
jgi:hypothetical protein